MTDLDEAHKHKGLSVECLPLGLPNIADFIPTIRKLSSIDTGRGRPRVYSAIEVTAHPSDGPGAMGATSAFSSREEMIWVGTQLCRELGGRYAMLALHGRRDLHLLVANWGATGLALRAYVPNRSNLRRVAVAVADRLEREINLTRVSAGRRPLRTMRDARIEANQRPGRHPYVAVIAAHLAAGSSAPTIQDVLLAIAACGWYGVTKRNKLLVQRPNEPSVSLEIDLLLRGLSSRGERARRKEKARDNESRAVDHDSRAIDLDNFQRRAEDGPSR